jgi:hypothetical protein
MSSGPGTFSVSSSRRIDAAPELLYGIIADYVTGHPQIIPPRYFRDLTVLKGGYGAGTEIAVTMIALGRETRFSAAVTEPIPGRVLVETAPAEGVVTSFRVEPGESGTGSDVTIQTELKARSGLGGSVERMVVSFALRRIYREELRRLETVARERATQLRETGK